jgi:hypothetical protein
MSRPPPKITCLFFSDVSVPVFLNTPVGRTLAGDLFVECGLRASLSYLLNVETPANYPGVAGLLGGVDLGTLTHPSDRVPAPILFAPGTPVAPAAVRAALALLKQPDERLDAVTLLVPIADAAALGAALAIADRFTIAWDVTAFPHAELVEFAGWLAAEKLVTAQNFAGLHPYAATAPDRAHSQRLVGILAPVVPKLPNTRAEVIVTTAA